MSVQELWQNLEAVFNTPSTAKEFPKEAVKFASIHKRWIKLMKAAHQVRSVLLGCMEGETPRDKQLADIRSGLEDCKKSLSSYLRSKRLVSGTYKAYSTIVRFYKIKLQMYLIM